MGQPARLVNHAQAATWRDLGQELDAWGRAGATATLWWRDDDASEPHPGLDRLLDLAGEFAAPLALAVIPALAQPELAALIARRSNAVVLAHGCAHVNHAPADAKKCELGAHRPPAAVLAELADGLRRLTGLFGPQCQPVLVPPWNRIHDPLIGRIAEVGFRGISRFNARDGLVAAPGVAQANCHVDLVDWRGARGFAGEGQALGQLCRHLRARRLNLADRAEPSGVLTHHRVMDAPAETFMRQLLAVTAAHPACRWLDGAAVFRAAP
jgi:hypothetical protein